MREVKTAADLAELARSARTALGWSQQQAADAAGVSRRFVNMLEGGQHANAEVWRVLAVLDALGVRLGVALPVDEPVTITDRPAGADEIDLDTYLSTFRTPPEPR